MICSKINLEEMLYKLQIFMIDEQNFNFWNKTVDILL